VGTPFPAGIRNKLPAHIMGSRDPREERDDVTGVAWPEEQMPLVRQQGIGDQRDVVLPAGLFHHA
jgi:hypothetical protein